MTGWRPSERIKQSSLILMHKGIEFVASQDREKFEVTLQSNMLQLTYENDRME